MFNSIRSATVPTLMRLPGRRVVCTGFRRYLHTRPATRILHGDPKPQLMSSELAAAPFKKSTFRTKVRNPMVPLLILVSLISSALIRVAAYQQEYDSLTRNYESKKAALREVIRRLEAGEVFDVKKEIEALNSSDSDKSLEELIKDIEQAESEWMVTNPEPNQPAVVETKSEEIEAPVPVATTPTQTGTESQTRTSKFL